MAPDPILDRVREVLDRSGMKKSEFAARVGLDGPKLTKSLKGDRRLSSLELALIADLGGATVDWILTGSRAPELSLVHRSSAAAIDAADVVARDTIELLYDRRDGLARIGYELPSPALPTIPSSSSWVRQAVLLASRYSELLGGPIGGLDNSDLFERVEEQFGIDIVVADLPEGCDGASYSTGDFRAIVLATSDAPFRQRYTLGHEIGHIAFGHTDDGIIEERLGGVKSHPERQADVFAASLLAPGDEIRRFIGKKSAESKFDALVLHFQLSPSSMSWRLYNEGLLRDSTRDAFSRESARRIAMREGVAADFAESARSARTQRSAARLVNAYINAYERGDATLRPAASLLGASVEEVERYFYEPSADDSTGSFSE